MFAYGIRCNEIDLPKLPNLSADYYLEHGLLVFPSYSRLVYLDNRGKQLSGPYLTKLKRIIETKRNAVQIDDMEHPYITEEEDTAVKILKAASLNADSSWYYIPEVATPDTSPRIVIGE